MNHSVYVLTIDMGTSAAKTCLFNIADQITLIESAIADYRLYLSDDGGAEQDPAEWWTAIKLTIGKVLADAQINPEKIVGISICSQMQGLVLVDQQCTPVRNAMSYMDQRAAQEFQSGIAYGIKIAGVNAVKLIKSLIITGAVAASVKDPVWKYKWVQQNEPENFKRVYKWLDVKDYLNARLTGEFTMTEGSAFATLLYDTRSGKNGWSKTVCRMLGVDMDHLPRIIKSTDVVGKITDEIAAELGLHTGTAVFGGGGDAELIGVGAGAVRLGDTHIYLGTSGWVSTVIDQRKVDVVSMIASIVGARPGYYNYFAEMETAGKCLEWVKDHLALDEIGVYLEKKKVTETLKNVYTSLYDYLCEVIDQAPAGCKGLIFTPWLHGNRSPFEDNHARGMFFNIGLDTGKTLLIRSVVEGICFHLRWMLEAQDKKIKTSEIVTFAGGGALSPVICQILADILGRTVTTVKEPQNVGAVGAAVVIAVGLNMVPSFNTAEKLIPRENYFYPNPDNKLIYDRNFMVFKRLYNANKKNFASLNS